MTTENNILEKLSALTQLDIDAVFAYQEALKNIDQQDIYDRISEFCEDHARHIEDLSIIISNLGGTPPKSTKDFKGYLIQGMTSLRGITGIEGTLKAMRANEEMTNKKYKEALEENDNLPIDIRRVIEANYSDEKRHLEYIKYTLNELEKVN
jgi:uncharacterized protein (TIGR02284 family)